MWKKINLTHCNGIDRVDNNIGYLLYNCKPCCANCNYLKKEYDYTEFLNKCKQIYEYNNSCVSELSTYKNEAVYCNDENDENDENNKNDENDENIYISTRDKMVNMKQKIMLLLDKYNQLHI